MNSLYPLTSMFPVSYFGASLFVAAARLPLMLGCSDPILARILHTVFANALLLAAYGAGIVSAPQTMYEVAFGSTFYFGVRLCCSALQNEHDRDSRYRSRSSFNPIDGIAGLFRVNSDTVSALIYAVASTGVYAAGCSRK